MMDKLKVDFICDEIGGEEAFWYSKTEQRYFKIDKDSKSICNTITGKNLPNPFEIEKDRLKERDEIKAAGGDYTGYRVLASPVTHKLWQHWNKIKGVENGYNNT